MSLYKPSPLSIGSPRTSPFRRPESPSTATPTSPTKSQWTPRGLPQVSRLDGTTSPAPVFKADTSSISKLSQAQVRELRDVFQVLDRDSDGLVKREDVADMLSNLGQDANTGAFFPNGQALSLPQFLTTLSSLLTPLSSPQELTAAFAAFDEDDSGQINAAELRDAVLNTAPEGDTRLSEQELEKVMNGFLGRRTFGKKGRDETFRYTEFVTAVSGSNASKEGQPE